MNKEYTYVDGKCVIQDEQGIIYDENGKPRVERYTDKLDEILIQENVIEELQEELEETEYDIPRREKIVKSEKGSMITFPIIFASIPFAVQQFIKLLVGEEIIQELLTSGDLINDVLKVFIISVTAAFGTIFTLSSVNNYRYNKKRLNGQISKKKSLEESLERAKQDLQEMIQSQQQAKLEEEACQVQVEDLETLRNIRNYINLYYDCGYNHQKYARYYREGKLSKKLSRYYTDSGIELIEEYLEENEPGIQRRLTK